MNNDGLFEGSAAVEASPVETAAVETESPAVEDGYNPTVEDMQRTVNTISDRNRAKGTLREKVETPKDLVWGNGEAFQFDTTGIEDFDPSKYQTPEDVIRHNMSMRKKISEFKPAPTAPEHYEIDSEVYNTDDPFLQKFTDIAKEHNVPEDTYQAILKFAMEQSTLAEEEAAKEAQAKENEWRQEQLQLLGDNPQARWNKISEWAAKELPEDMQEVMAANVKSAKDVQLWEFMINKRHDYTQPPGKTKSINGTSYPQLSRAKLAEMMREKRYIQGDPTAVKEVTEYARKLSRQH